MRARDPRIRLPIDEHGGRADHPGADAGPAKDGVHTVDVKLSDGKPETIKAKKVVLATGSDAPRATWKLDGTLQITTTDNASWSRW